MNEVKPHSDILQKRVIPRYYIFGILIGFALFHFSQSIFWQYGSYYLFTGIGETAFLLIGLVGGLPIIIGLIGVYFWGAISDRWHRRVPFMIIGFLAQAIAFFLYTTPFVQNSISFLIITCIAYLFSLAAVPMANAYLTEAQRYKGGAVGLLLAIGSLGWAFGAFSGGFLFTLINMAGLFLLGAVFYIIGAITILLLVREIPYKPNSEELDEKTQDHEKETETKKHAPLRVLYTISSAVILGTIGWNAFSFFFGVYLISEIGGTALMVGIANGFAALVGLGVTLAAGYGSDRLGRKPVILLGFVGYASFMIIYVLIFDPWIAMILWIIPVYPLVYTASYSAAADVSRVAYRGRAMSIVATANSIGSGIGPIIGGAIVQFLFASLRANMIFATAFNITAFILVVLFVPETLRRINQRK